MKDTEYIIGIYDYINVTPERNSDQACYILYLMDERGLLDRVMPLKIYEEFFKTQLANDDQLANVSNLIGPFGSTDLLNQYAFKLCEELNAEKISLHSVQEYNLLLESTQMASDFHRDLLIKGNVMENIERKKKGFLNRFF